jgi:hypothetical protein
MFRAHPRRMSHVSWTRKALQITLLDILKQLLKYIYPKNTSLKLQIVELRLVFLTLASCEGQIDFAELDMPWWTADKDLKQ